MASVAYGGGGPTYANGTTMDLTVTGKYCTDLKLGGPEKRISTIGAPKVDGFGTKDFGKGVQVLIAEIIYVNSSESAIISAAQTDFTVISVPLTVTAGGLTLQACLSKPTLSQPKSNGFGAFMATGTITITRLRYA